MSELATACSLKNKKRKADCLATAAVLHFQCQNMHISAISESKNEFLLNQAKKARLVFAMMLRQRAEHFVAGAHWKVSYVIVCWSSPQHVPVSFTALLNTPQTPQNATPTQTEQRINTAAGVRHFAECER